ncbi:uncharacterized protein LOC111404272 isoform X5 [Olea europaea var. sylvestris]|uniref:uncharacterized protein LOC111404272 isoform X5 n=1 Tax=Olea europaea var. sylvestris TaxID=158386 RepID=UPI000C1D7169|nr:uncharacterized protein LOC111404272 isoform X5 [Olea europaea var. sylvestris]
MTMLFSLFHFPQCRFSSAVNLSASSCGRKTMDWGFVQRIWDKWASNYVGSSGQPLRGALLINYDPTGPARLVSTMCMNTSKPAGEGAIVMQTAAFLLVGLYEGSIGSASRPMVAVDQFAWQLGRRNL